jgi:hypothetical protein
MKNFNTPDAFTRHERVCLSFDAARNLCPVDIADARSSDRILFSLMAAGYQTTAPQHFGEAWPKGTASGDAQAFKLLSHRVSTRGEVATLTAHTESSHFKVTKRFTINAREPWLHTAYTLRSTGEKLQARATQLQMPAIFYGEEMANPLDAALFDFSFGRILPDGFESPPYLTFWMEDRKSGVLVWTKTKEAMRRLFPRDHFLSGVHPALSCGSANTDDPLWSETDFRIPATWEFFLWPIKAREWKAATQVLHAMKFRGWNQRAIAALSRTTHHDDKPTSLYLSADEIAAMNPEAIDNTAVERRWWHIKNRNSSLLFAQDAFGTKPLKIRHDLHGRYRIWIETCGGSGVALSTSRSTYPIPLDDNHNGDPHPFYNALLADADTPELDAGVWELANNVVELSPHPMMYSQTLIGAIRFEPIATTPQTKSPSNHVIYGITDTPDIAQSDGTLDARPYRANVAEHARLGYKILYWRADGQCSDFHTEIGTVRYPVRRTHNVFTPCNLPYGYVLRDHNLLSVAVEEARRHDLKLFGYMRLNGFRGNATAQFYLDHPELRDVMEIGTSSPRMCYYLPEFRRWKVEIAREVVRHGVDGLLLDLTRNPMMVDYHPRVVDAYLNVYGVLPPRNLKRGYVSYGVHPLEKGEEWIRWWKFRAQGFSDFGRELRTMLREEGQPDLPIHVQVRPQMALFDGLDLETWIEEGLLDLLNVWPTPDFHVPDEVFEATKNRVPLRCTVSFLHDSQTWQSRMEEVLGDARFDGLTIYESNMAVWSPPMRALTDSWLART